MTLSGKVAALLEQIPQWQVVEERLRSADFIRHLLDLYLCHDVYVPSDIVRSMRSLLPQGNDELEAVMRTTVDILRMDPFYAQAYQHYVGRMFVQSDMPSRTYEGAVTNFERLCQHLLNPAPTDAGRRFRRSR